jgi:hypothetical protein
MIPADDEQDQPADRRYIAKKTTSGFRRAWLALLVVPSHRRCFDGSAAQTEGA